MYGGGGGIRTRETIHHRLHTFQACAFNRSATPPRRSRIAQPAGETSRGGNGAQPEGGGALGRTFGRQRRRRPLRWRVRSLPQRIDVGGFLPAGGATRPADADDNPDRRRDLMTAALMVAAPRTLRRLRQLTGLRLAGPMPAAEADLSRVDIARLAAEVIAIYATNLRLVRLLAQAYGFRTVFFWQPVITTKQVLTRDEQRWDKDYTKDPEARRRLYSAIVKARRGCPEIVDAEDTVDLSALFDDWTDPVYIDLYHLSETGNAAVAEAMLPAVIAAASAMEQQRRRE